MIYIIGKLFGRITSYNVCYTKLLRLGVKVYRPTEEEMKLWKANMDALYADVLKDAPQVLEYIKEIQKMKN